MNLQTILDMFTEQTRGDGGEVVNDRIHIGVMHTPRIGVVAWYDAEEGVWKATVLVGALQDVAYTAPLQDGICEDEQEVVDWLREICDCAPDRDDDDLED